MGFKYRTPVYYCLYHDRRVCGVSPFFNLLLPTPGKIATLESPLRRDDPLPARPDLWIAGWEPAPGRLARARMDSAGAIHALEKFDHHQLLPGCTIIDCIAAAALRDPGKAAMVYLSSADLRDAPRIVRYDELLNAVQRAAALFVSSAGSQRSVVGVILPMLPESLIAVWGAQSAGIAVPINPQLEAGLVISIRGKETNLRLAPSAAASKAARPWHWACPTVHFTTSVGAKAPTSG